MYLFFVGDRSPIAGFLIKNKSGNNFSCFYELNEVINAFVKCSSQTKQIFKLIGLFL